MEMTARAFSPGHITGFFQVCDDQDVLSCGSMGAGMNISLGAVSDISVSSGEGGIEVWLNGMKGAAPVTEDAILHVLGDEKLDVVVRTELQLPVAQGFGTSAAGSLSAALALCHALGKDRQLAFEAAHRAEIKNRTGMGDVSGIFRGGLEFRRKAGLPPRGTVESVPGEMRIVLAVVGPPISTRTILDDVGIRARINEVGGYCVQEMAKSPDMENFICQSKRFMMSSGLSTPEVRRAVRAAQYHGKASMCMIGNAIFAVGNTDALERELSELGQTYVVDLDHAGARLL